MGVVIHASLIHEFVTSQHLKNIKRRNHIDYAYFSLTFPRLTFCEEFECVHAIKIDRAKISSILYRLVRYIDC